MRLPSQEPLGHEDWPLLKEFAKDTVTVAALFVCTVAVIAVLLMMVYVWQGSSQGLFVGLL